MVAQRGLGGALIGQGDEARAQACLEQALEIFRKPTLIMGIAFSMLNLGELAARRGDFDQARAAYQESVEQFEQLQNQN